jgi:hypothetical protein
VSQTPVIRRNSILGGFVLLLIRGILLWVVVPVATCVWLVVALRLRRRGVTLGRFLGWIDLNLVACLQRTILRPLFRAPRDWVPVDEMPKVTHRLRASDPA